MGFRTAVINFARNGDAPQSRWRQDVVSGDVITVALSDTAGATTFRWRLFGRPEGSGAGGAGPEPLELGTAVLASFVVDRKGTYTVECLVNGGTPDAIAITGGCAYLESFTTPSGLPLRLIGPGETDEDVADPLVEQGHVKMENRWRTLWRGGLPGGDTYKVKIDENDNDPDYLFYKVESDATITITKDLVTGKVKFSSSAMDDHLVIASPGNVPHTHHDGTTSGNGSISSVVAGEQLDQRVVCSSDLPLPDGVANAGTPGKQPAAIDHVHPFAMPSTARSVLYTALVPDKYRREEVDAVYYNTPGSEDPTLFLFWTQVATGVWKRNIQGPIPSTMTDGVTPFVGMRVLAWSPYMNTDPHPLEKTLPNVYVVTATGGSGDFYARMERAPDCATPAQVYSGIWTHVKNGTVYGPGSTGFPTGATFRLSTADPIELGVTELTWSTASPPAVLDTNELLTAGQLSLASSDTTTAYATVGSGTGEVELVTCREHDAALAGVILPAGGEWRAHLKLSLAADDPSAITTVRFYLRGTSGSFALVGETQALHNTTPQMWVTPAGTLGADYLMATGEKLEAKFTARSNSTALLQVALIYNDGPHSSFIEVPFPIDYAGIGPALPPSGGSSDVLLDSPDDSVEITGDGYGGGGGGGGITLPIAESDVTNLVEDLAGKAAVGAAPTAHAASHTSGADQIADATASNHGLATAAQIAKLDGIAPGATALALGTTAGTACDGADSRLSNARTANAILETGGPTTLTVGAVADGQFLKRSGSTVIGAAASGGSVALSLYTSMMLG